MNAPIAHPLHDAWTSLRHGGHLLSPAALESLPAPRPPKHNLAATLRKALVELDPDAPSAPALAALLDTVLETTTGLVTHWRKGPHLGAADACRLLDGTTLKPRRIWEGPAGDTLHVFTTPARRVGVGKGRRPVAQVTEYLRRTEHPLALLTNGQQWRLIWADTDTTAWVEWDSDRFLDADQLTPELRVFRRVVCWEALHRGDGERSPLLNAVRLTRRGQSKLSKELGERVRKSVETLLRSRAPVLGPVWADHNPSHVYNAACHFVMRFVVVLFAEARELLPVDNPVYHNAYGLRGLLDQLDPLSPERRRSRRMAWPRLLSLFRLLHQGSFHAQVQVPRYGGDLFQPGNASGDGVQRALAVLEGLAEPPDDDTVHRMLVLLTRTMQKVQEGSTTRKVAAPVDFTELTSEYIGILYEGLLDYELHRAAEHPVVFLNLGDQPALPLDRLEEMDDRTLKALVEKAKVKKKSATEGDGEGEDDGEDEDENAAEGTDGDEDTSDEDSDDSAERDDDDIPDDLRAEAMTRAVDWGRRAAEVAALVKKPKSKKADALAAYNAQLDSAANQLVADLKLPGELFLVRWGGTRKGSGTFYTRPQLTLPTTRRTLEPLLHDDSGTIQPPEKLLALKVCDPAMGSGSFLVAALRVLTDAVKESLYHHGRIVQTNGRTTVQCEALPEADRTLPTEGFEDRLLAVVRRAVVEHCLYGVDKDPLAVELARVSLWVETLDRDLPFTFLDHKLRCGDALVGTWLDRFRFYPLLAFDRKSPDEKWRGVHHESDVWKNALKKKRQDAIDDQVRLLEGRQDFTRSEASEEQLKKDVARVRRLYRDLRDQPASRPDERARIWKDRILGDAALNRVKRAFDTWCALWFWPLDKLDAIPLPRELAAPSAESLAVVDDVQKELRFFHWELEFPDVFTQLGAGFDAVVGNPPWETLQPQSKEFFTNYDPLYRSYGKQDGLRTQRRLFSDDPTIEHGWLRYQGGFNDFANYMRNVGEPFGDGKVAGHGGADLSLLRGKKGAELHRKWRIRRGRFTGTSDPNHPFAHQGSGKAYTFKLFTEAGLALLATGGQLGLVVPSGLYTDKGTGDLRRLLLDACSWRWLYGFENRNKVFDIHRSFKFCVAIAQKGGETETIAAAFMRHELEDWDEQRAVLGYPAERVKTFSPKSLSVLEIRSEQDLAVLNKLYDNGVLLGDQGPDGWGIQYRQGDFNMTSDSKLFIGRDKAEAQGYRPDVYGRWVNEAGDVLLPLYEGRMIGQFDFSEKGWVQGKGRSAEWREIPWEDKRIEPQYLMRARDAQSAIGNAQFKTVMMNIGSATNRRSMYAATVPNWPANHALATLSPRKAEEAVELGACLSAFTFDWALRGRLGGLNISWFVLEESPLPRTRAGRPVAARLSGVAPPASPIRVLSSPSRRAITPHERLRLRCMLDAIVAALYGLDRADFAWILKDCDHPVDHVTDRKWARQLDPKGFWRVDKDKPPEHRHTVLSLAAFDDLQATITALDGDRDAGIQAFCDQHDGDGWMLPETLCIADLGLTRTVDAGTCTDRARTPQPVRSALGPRFLDWQLSQSVEESWAECEAHAKAIREGTPAPPMPERTEKPAKPASPQQKLF